MPTFTNRLRRGAAGLGAALLLASGAGVLAAPAGAAPTAAAAATVADTPMCPAAAGNARFVRWIYIQILMRCPDAGGLNYWTARLDGGLPRSAFTDAIDMSTENVVDNNVMELYQGMLDRAPSSTELAAGIDSIRSTKSDADLISFINSKDEVFAHYETFDAWLNDVYNGVLERDADANGMNFFDDFISDPSTAGERRWIVKTLEHSPENAADWTGAAMGAAFNREPDGGGMAYWTAWLQGAGHWQTFRMWSLMLASPEGYAVAQLQLNPPSEEAAPLR